MQKLRHGCGGGLERIQSTGQLVWLLPLLALAGCTGLEPALIGAAASGVQTGSSVAAMGKLNSAWIAKFDQVIAASEVACGDLGLSIRTSTGNAEEGKWLIVAFDEQGDKYKIIIQRETAELTRFRIDVGWFGYKPTTRLLLKRIALSLHEMGLEDGGDLSLAGD